MLSEAQKQFMEVMLVPLAEQYYQMYKAHILTELYNEAMEEARNENKEDFLVIRFTGGER